MGCRKQAKKAFKWFGENILPHVWEAAKDIVLDLEDDMYAVLSGTEKEVSAVAALKIVAKREGQELRTSVAKTIVNGVVAMAHGRVDGDVNQLGTDDTAEEALP